MKLLATTPTTWLQFIYDSPVLVAIITVLAVKALDVLNDRLKLMYGARKEAHAAETDRVRDLEKQLESMNAQNIDRMKSLEKNVETLNVHNDTLILDNAKMSARISILEAQNAAQLAELAHVRQERDQLRQQVESANETIHRTGLELRAAQVRIKQLESYTKQLEERIQVLADQAG